MKIPTTAKEYIHDKYAFDVRIQMPSTSILSGFWVLAETGQQIGINSVFAKESGLQADLKHYYPEYFI